MDETRGLDLVHTLGVLKCICVADRLKMVAVCRNTPLMEVAEMRGSHILSQMYSMTVQSLQSKILRMTTQKLWMSYHKASKWLLQTSVSHHRLFSI